MFFQDLGKATKIRVTGTSKKVLIFLNQQRRRRVTPFMDHGEVQRLYKDLNAKSYEPIGDEFFEKVFSGVDFILVRITKQKSLAWN